MIALLAVGLATSTTPDVLAAERPDPIVLLVIVPKSMPARLRVPDIIEAGNAVFSANTDLTLVNPSRAGVSDRRLRECRGETRLLCWAKEVAAPSSQSRWLLVVTPLAAQNDVRLSALLMDVERALAIDEKEPTILLDRVYDEATAQSKRMTMDPNDRRALQRFFEESFRGGFESMLSDAGRTRRFAEVDVETAPGSTLEVDGRVLGVTRGAKTRITRLRSGSHEIAVVDPTSPDRRVVRSVEVGPEARPTLALHFEKKDRDPRMPMLVGGGAGIALGVSSIVWGASRTRRIEPCFQSQCSGDRRSFDGFVPIGVGLLVAGAGVSAAAFFSDDETAWWIVASALAAGVVAGSVVGVVR